MLPYLWMLVSAAAFTCMSELAHALNGRCHWMVVALARTSLALVFTYLLARSRGIPLYFWRPRTLWMRSLTGSVSLLCTFYAFKNLPASDVVAFTNMFPIWVAVLSWPMLRERPGREVWLAVAASVVGSFLINQPHLGESAATSDRFGGSLAAFVSSVLSAVVVIGLNLLQHLPSQAIVVHFSGISTVFCLAAMPVAGASWRSLGGLSPSTYLLLAAMGLSATVGQIFLTKAFAAGQASKVAVVALSQVVFCYAFELVFLGRDFHLAPLVGMILIIGPTAWMLLRRTLSHAAQLPAEPAESIE